MSATISRETTGSSETSSSGADHRTTTRLAGHGVNEPVLDEGKPFFQV